MIYDRNGNGSLYLGTMIFSEENGLLSLESVGFKGGRFFKVSDVTQNSESAFVPFYFITDHLGSTRAVVDSRDGTLVERDDYYPFGMGWQRSGPEMHANRWKYNGKEEQNRFGVRVLDYGARQYDPGIARWTSPDPLEEKYSSLTSYCYVANNPITFLDSEGNDIVIAGKENTSVTLKTDLIDIRVNASSLGVNWGGNYVLQGEDLLSATLDIVGIIDPYGVADGLNATLQAKNGDWLGASISTMGLVPYVGDVAKLGKIGNDVKIIQTSINSAKATKSISALRKQAVREAWKAEQQLVKKGGGTRFWTKAEKAELLRTGKVKGYVGHHINNVKDHPDLAGDPNNIRFVKRSEHLEAHGGNFRNETHGDLLNRNPNGDKKVFEL